MTYKLSGIATMLAALCFMLGAAPSFAGPPNNDVSDAFGNTAGGTGALKNNTGHNNTAFGDVALQNNTGAANSAFGWGALVSNTGGAGNTALGWAALGANLTGGLNTAVGESALQNNTTGAGNTGIGQAALAANTTGVQNTALGYVALEANTTGPDNTAVGFAALFSNASTKGVNSAFGTAALEFSTGTHNLALGAGAGQNLRSGDNNIYLGAGSPATESNTMRLGEGQTHTFIAGVAGTALSGSQVLISSTGQLGILASSARYKRDISAMGARSRKLLELRPVTFRYKQDRQRALQYGLVAEEVAKVYPELVTRRADGVVESVQYHELIPMLLNELQRQQRELRELKDQSARLQATVAGVMAASKPRLVRLEEPGFTAPLASR